MQEVANEISELASRLDPKNDFGYTVGDELHELNYYLKSIAETLEKIESKMK